MGRVVTEHGDCDTEIRIHIQIVKVTLIKLMQLLRNRNVSLERQKIKAISKCYII